MIDYFLENFDRMYFEKNGRITRAEYWIFGAAVLFFSTFLIWVMMATANANIASMNAVGWIMFALPSLVGVKRFHDFGLSWKWYAAFVITLFVILGVSDWAQLILFAVCGIIPGNKGTNKYGAVPTSVF